MFASALGFALPLPVYHAILRKADMEIPEKSLAARNDLLEGLASLSTFDVAPHIEKISQQMGVFPHELKREIEERRTGLADKTSRRLPEDDSTDFIEAGEGADAEQKNSSEPDDLECIFCSIIWENEKVRSRFPEYVVPFIKMTYFRIWRPPF